MRLAKKAKNGTRAVAEGISTTRRFAKDLRKADSIQDVIDAMIDVPTSRIENKVNQLRAKNPGATPADIQEIVTKQFRKLAATTSGAAGAAAAVPGLGTAAALGLSSAQLTGFVSEAGYYVLTLAHIHGIALEDKEKRRLLVLTALMGEQGEEIATSQFGFTTLTALKGYASDVQRQTINQVNRKLTKMAAKRAARTGTKAMLGRLMPYGIGAGLGWVIGRSMAGNVIDGALNALGTPPPTFSYPLTIEVEVQAQETQGK
ncbi:hypothetical protein [Gleimia europaea]|uniref:EcsC protein family protein n=1 Tax=Gleimia europaea ACS-120-V-Col10b TaxID=883069 RepID=A0A9W5RCW8_9ACTO|nr:hypothetical protein [Gleimia europaea]EPD29456.1 hypothetical protein HMPREF9238_01593 [Gleimia europaea ACS-120-V-Col10b]